MGRSVKKGPYVEASLLKKVLQMNEAGEKKVVKTWSRASVIFPDSLVIRSRCMTAANTFRSM